MTPSVVVVGCGYWGANHVRCFSELGALAGVVDDRVNVAEDMARKYNVPALRLEAAIADPNVKGIVIATPAVTHTRLALMAIAAGKHVLVEKPIALSLADGEAMADAADKRGVTLMVGHLLRYHPAFKTLLAAVQAGELGAIRYVYSQRLSLGIFRTEENVLLSLAPHDVSMLLAIFGEEPESVLGSGGAYISPPIEDEFRLDLRFSGGRHGHVFVSWLNPFKEQRLVVVGEKAMAVFEDSKQGAEKLRLYRHGVEHTASGAAPIKGEPELMPFPAEEPLRNECLHFLACCAGETEPCTDAAEALRVLSVLLAGLSDA